MKNEIMDLVESYGQEIKDYGYTTDSQNILRKIEELLKELTQRQN